MKPNKFVVIGIGGIGSHFAPNLVRMLAHMADLNEVEIILVDGDRFEDRNVFRQNAVEFINKSKAMARHLIQMYEDMQISAMPLYVGSHNDQGSENSIPASELIEDGDWVFLCVDNNKTRLWVSQWVQTLDNIVLLDGGNELMDGSVQLYIRQDGQNITPPIETYNPQISNPEDVAPQESCEVAFAAGNTQLLITNLMVANIMLARFWCLLEQNKPIGSTVTFFDFEQINSKGTFARSDYYPSIQGD